MSCRDKLLFFVMVYVCRDELRRPGKSWQDRGLLLPYSSGHNHVSVYVCWWTLTRHLSFIFMEIVVFSNYFLYTLAFGSSLITMFMLFLQMCDILGIVEKDYFGLLYQDRTSGCSLWMNNRLRVNSQLKSRPPYRLRLGVKYFVEPEILLQTSSMWVRTVLFQM